MEISVSSLMELLAFKLLCSYISLDVMYLFRKITNFLKYRDPILFFFMF